MKKETKIEHFAQLLMDSNPQYIFWKDIEGIYLGCNKLYADFCNLESTEKIIGTTDYNYMSKDEAQICIAADQEVANSGNSILNFEEYVTNAHGVSRWYNINKIALKNKEGIVTGVLGTMTDVTELKKKNLLIKKQAADLAKQVEILKHLNTKLELTNSDLEQFAYSTSHDLQEPLRTVLNFTSILNTKHADALDQEGLNCLGFLNEGTNRMSQLIKQILNYTKIDKIEENLVNISLQSVLDLVLQDLKDVIDSKNVTFDIDLPKDTILCHPQRIQSLFLNLISNGIKFNTSDNPHIIITHEDQESHWHFAITDNGIGIDPKYHETILKPFKRLHTKDQYEGTGLGLSLCKKVVFIHKGEIHISNNKDQGTTFHFTIAKNLN